MGSGWQKAESRERGPVLPGSSHWIGKSNTAHGPRRSTFYKAQNTKHKRQKAQKKTEMETGLAKGRRMGRRSAWIWQSNLLMQLEIQRSILATP
jgi:hypothetical protein